MISMIPRKNLPQLIQALKNHDGYTFDHSVRVAHLLCDFGQELPLPLSDNDLYVAGLLHDIGKLFVNPNILDNKNALTADQFEEIKRHPSYGSLILKQIGVKESIVKGVLAHHENLNGSGYYGMHEHDISLLAKTIRIVDSYDAMTNRRPYSSPMTKTEALNEIDAFSGTYYDSFIASRFMDFHMEIA